MKTKLPAAVPEISVRDVGEAARDYHVLHDVATPAREQASAREKRVE